MINHPMQIKLDAAQGSRIGSNRPEVDTWMPPTYIALEEIASANPKRTLSKRG